MAITTISTSTTAAIVALSDGDTWIVNAGVNVAVSSGSAIVAGANNLGFLLSGSLVSDTVVAVFLGTSQATRFQISESGSVFAGGSGISGSGGFLSLINAGSFLTFGYGVDVSGGSNSISNTGTMVSTAFSAIRLAADSNTVNNLGLLQGRKAGIEAVGDRTKIINDGSIVALATNTADGSIGINLTGDLNRIINRGEISSDLGVVLGGASGRANLDNSGSITASSYGVFFTNLGLELTNTGEITASMSGTSYGIATFVSAASSTLVNYGTVSGTFSVFLANQDDSLSNFGALNGNVAMGGGNDSFLNAGSVLGDVFLGAGNDLFDGRGGTLNGVLSGGLGDDVFKVSTSDIELLELLNEGVDQVRATVSFALGDNFENLRLLGGGNTSGIGNGLDNVLVGNSGDNRLQGLGGVDTLNGKAGDDRLSGGGGSDVLRGGLGQDRLFGNAGNDKIFGGDGGDRLLGARGNDTLKGEDGADVLIGGLGKDRLFGGLGADLFVFRKALDSPNSGGADLIKDFAQGEDLVDLSALGGLSFIGGASFTGTGGEVRVQINGVDTDVFIDVDGDGVADMKIVVGGTTSLQAADFIL